MRRYSVDSLQRETFWGRSVSARLLICALLSVTAACSGGTATPPRGALSETERYVLRIFAENGCEMHYDEFAAVLDAEGLDASWPRRGGPDAATRERIERREEVYFAVASLLEDGVLVADPSDSNRVRSLGQGC